MTQRARQWTFGTVVIAVAVALLASAASAAQNVANTAQKGSLLVFPLIDVRFDPVELPRTTVIRIANDFSVAIDVKCYYVNQQKVRRGFQFLLTKKQPLTWDALSGVGDPINVPPFPTDTGTVGGDPRVGELICFAVNAAGSNQISHNHLSGTVTVHRASGAYEYNSWNFTARGVDRGLAVGTRGRLDLTGENGAYDACPLYNILHFAPTDTFTDNLIQYIDTEVGVSSCLQDLRETFDFHFTKIQIHVWNAQEIKLTGASECADSTHNFPLTGIDVLPENTSFDRLSTTTAHATLRGIGGVRCVYLLRSDLPEAVPVEVDAEAAGLLAVAATTIFDEVFGTRRVVGTTTNHAGSPQTTPPAPVGFVLWDPQEVAPESVRR